MKVFLPQVVQHKEDKNSDNYALDQKFDKLSIFQEGKF